MSNNQYDIEVGLISKILESGDFVAVKDKQIKAYFISDGDNRKAFKYINDFYLKNGSVPTIRVFKQQFPNFILDTYKNAQTFEDTIGTEEPITFWCDEVRTKVKHNKICDIAEEMAEALNNLDTEKAYGLMKKGLIYIENDVVETQAIDTTKDADDRKASYLKRKENRGMIGIPMGIDKLDMLLKGMQKKQLITLIAKTGVGKSWFYVLIASYCQLNGYRVLFFTTEMAEEQIEDRLEAMLIPMMMGEEFNYGRFKSGTLTPQEEKIYFDFLDMKSTLEPLIVETATGVSNVSAKIEQYQPDVVFIDGAYLMEDDQGAKEDWLRVAHITRDLKALAKLKKIPICINSQADSTTSKKTGPELENIGFSKAIGHDSDVVLGLVRDEEMIEDREMKVKVLKQREGTLGNVVLNWDFTTMNFSTLYSENGNNERESPEDRGLIDIT